MIISHLVPEAASLYTFNITETTSIEMSLRSFESA
jgi:hypothetical protein